MNADLSFLMLAGEIVGILSAALFVTWGHVDTPAMLGVYGLAGAIYCRLWLNTYEEDT